MRLLDTSRRLATSAMRVPAKPRSITTSHVVSRISLRRSATVGFFTAANAIAVIIPKGDSPLGEWVEDAGESRRVASDRQLFEDAHAVLRGAIRRDVCGV